MDDFSRWLPFSPFRRPEWRWLRATYLHQTGRRRDRRLDDAWVDHARDALRGRGRGRSPADDVRAARGVWEGDPDRRGEVEARLLAADGDGEIASRTGVPERVVAAYAEVFFEVRPALATGGSDWLMSEAVGHSPFGGFTRPRPWAAWRLAAVAGGPRLMDVVIAATTGRPLPAAFAAGGEDERHVRELARLWVALMAAVTPAAFAAVLRDYRRLRTADAKRRGRPAAARSMVDVMESLLLSRSVSGVSPDSPAPPPADAVPQLAGRPLRGPHDVAGERPRPGTTARIA